MFFLVYHAMQAVSLHESHRRWWWLLMTQTRIYIYIWRMHSANARRGGEDKGPNRKLGFFQ